MKFFPSDKNHETLFEYGYKFGHIFWDVIGRLGKKGKRDKRRMLWLVPPLNAIVGNWKERMK
jgi:hypothetical protein